MTDKTVVRLKAIEGDILIYASNEKQSIDMDAVTTAEATDIGNENRPNRNEN